MVEGVAASAIELRAFLAEAECRSWQLGTWDCMMAISTWVEMRTGIDPAQSWRGAYWDEGSRLVLLKRARGGFLGMMRRGFAKSGLVPSDDPQPGDVGLVKIEAPNRAFARGRVGALMIEGGFWWAPSERGGGSCARPPLVSVIAAWRVP